jgi:hypothetical protein
VRVNDAGSAAPYGGVSVDRIGTVEAKEEEMLTGIRKTIIAGLLAGFAALLIAAPASAMQPEGGKAGSQSRHLSAVSARVGGFGANTLYAIGCANGTIPGPTGGDNNNYDYFGDPCGS